MEKNIDILSFDGGGSRGIMELCILDDVMRLATIVLEQPERVDYLLQNEHDRNKKNVLKNPDTRKRLIDDLEKITNPIHPTEVYEMIIGTSTGAVIAFGLVGGKEIKKGKDEKPKRAPMSVKECIDMYLAKTKKIFTMSWTPWLASRISSIPFIPWTYSQDNVKEVLRDQFGDSILEDFSENSGLKCVAGAVARKLGNEEELVLFDTRSEDYRYYKTYQVLLASSNAPFYFNTPVSIGMNDFVDGGVGGNCPLAQAIPRAKELFGKDGKDAKITSALSMAPPHSSKTEVPQGNQTAYWINYFVNESTDGYAVYRDVVKCYRREETLFQRLSPRGEKLKEFKLDEVDVQRMLDAMKREKEENEMFLFDVIATAMQVVFTFFDKEPNRNENVLRIAAQLAETAGNAYYSKKEYGPAIGSYKTSIRMRKKLQKMQESKKFITDDSKIFKINHTIAKCLVGQGKYELAIETLSSSMEVLDTHHDDANNAKLFVDIVIDLADCYVKTYRYEEAEGLLEKKVLPTEDSRAHNLMAWCKQEQGKLDEAVIQYREARSHVPDNDTCEMAEIINNLGVCYVHLGMYNKALKLIRKAQQIRYQLPSLYLRAESHIHAGACLIKQEQYAQAHLDLRKAEDLSGESEDDKVLSHVLMNLARCLALNPNRSREDNSLALNHAQQALAEMRKYVGDSLNPGIAKIRAVIGLCLFNNGKLHEAEEKLLESSRMIRKLFKSENHHNLLEVYETLSKLNAKKGRQDVAQIYQTKVNSINDEIRRMATQIDGH